MLTIGYDIGSSSIKAALVDIDKNEAVKVVYYPDTEMAINSPHPGWAEQDPEMWWDYLTKATQKLLSDISASDRKRIKGIGISYQMHGLVLVDKNNEVLRPSIIWCDSRAIPSGEYVLGEIGSDESLQRLLNLPGNFTFSKLVWVMQNEPEVFKQVDKILLPGDYINLKLTGEINTTPSALSEGTLWDFKAKGKADFLLDAMGINQEVIPNVVDTFSEHGKLTEEAANALGVEPGIIVGYRAGDQPNNAMSLGVLNPGEIAATGGTSGVVYGVVDDLVYDTKNRVNSFAHVNHTNQLDRIGVLLCINGSGSQYRWLRQQMANGSGYEAMEDQLSKIPVNSDGVLVFPFGNGAERMLENKDIGSSISNIDFNRHDRGNLYRAALEGIAFSFAYGMEVMRELGLSIDKMKVGNDNLFRSNVFSNTVSSLVNAEIEIMEVTGAVGAARGVAHTLGAGSLEDLMSGNKTEKIVTPDPAYQSISDGFGKWKGELNSLLNI